LRGVRRDKEQARGPIFEGSPKTARRAHQDDVVGEKRNQSGFLRQLFAAVINLLTEW